MMASERQIAANRANSLKSTDHTNLERRRKSPRNSLHYGMLARTIVLDGESHQPFMLLLSTLQEESKAQTAVEINLVESMAVARCRQMRRWSMEKSALGHEIRNHESAPNNNELSSQDAPTRASLASRSLSDCSASLEPINRTKLVTTGNTIARSIARRSREKTIILPNEANLPKPKLSRAREQAGPLLAFCYETCQ